MCPYDSAQTAPQPVPQQILINPGNAGINNQEINDLKEQIDEAVRVLSLLKHDHIGINNPKLKAKLVRTMGKYEYPDSTFVGEMMNGVPHGKGKMICTYGYICTGNMYNDDWEGEVVNECPDGRIDRVQYRDGIPNGYYEYTFPNGRIQTGCFKDGKYHGPMYSISPGHNNNIQFSLYNNGEQTGQFMQINGERTQMRFGQFVQGKKHGEMRIFTLNRRQMYINGQCTNPNL